MLNKPALILCAAATLAPSFANAALLQDLFDGDCLTGPGGASACNWTQEYDLGAVSPDYTAIDVVFDFWPGVLGSVPTINYLFDPALFVENGQDISFGFNYTLTAPGGVSAVDLELTGVEILDPFGFIQVIDSYFVDGVLVGELVAEIDPAFGTDDNPVFTDLSGTYTSLFVEKEILIQSTVGSVALGDMHQGYAPVPGTLALFAGGLAGVAAVRRRRVRAATRA